MSESAVERLPPGLKRLARLNGVLTEYYNDKGRLIQSSRDAVLRALAGLQPELEGRTDFDAAWREQSLRLWDWQVEPVLPAWDGRPNDLALRVPEDASGGLELRLELEAGEVREWRAALTDLPATRAATIGGKRFLSRALTLERLPLGYHRLHLRRRGWEREVLIVSAPRRAYEQEDGDRRWGVFLPLYALHSRSSWGAGSYSDLAALGEWISAAGGNLVATLPLLPTYLSEPYDPSPYNPVSRFFWNEFYVDPLAAPGFAACREAQETVASAAFQSEVDELRRLPYVDYRRQMALKRRVLSQMAGHVFASEDGAELRRYVAQTPEVADYARFRALREEQARPWAEWPEGAQVQDEGTYRFYVYAQYLAEQQLQALAQRSRARGDEIYLDLPLGCNPDGYDTWRYRESFVPRMATGAPPDALFIGGQNWGFPPLHPVKQRENGYEVFRKVIAHHLKIANFLRIDHVMGLHRLYWVPDGFSAREGVYVRYNADEMYAILCLESHRNRATILGENLGTVPPSVNAALRRHGIYQSYVLQYELGDDPNARPRRPPVRSVASLNTHDMPPFAAFLAGSDIEQRVRLGMTDEAYAARERVQRAAQKQALTASLRECGETLPDDADAGEAFRAAVRYLGRSRARYVLLNLEDAWQETGAQNIPGTATIDWRDDPLRTGAEPARESGE